MSEPEPRTGMGSVCIIYYNVWPGILQQTIYVGRPVLGKPTTSRTQLGTHKELAEHAWGTYKELLPVTQGIETLNLETLWLATRRMRNLFVSPPTRIRLKIKRMRKTTNTTHRTY